MKYRKCYKRGLFRGYEMDFQFDTREFKLKVLHLNEIKKFKQTYEKIQSACVGKFWVCL